MSIGGISSMSRAVPDAGGGGKRSRILQQIKKLEEKRDKLLEKLAMVSSGGPSPDTTKAPTWHVGSGSSQSSSAPVAAPAFPTASSASVGDAASAAAAGLQALPPAPTPAPAAAPLRMRASDPLMQASSGESFDVDDLPQDPEQIMQLVQAIEAQIVALRTQLGDEELLSAANDMMNGLIEKVESGQEPEAADGGLHYATDFGDTVDISAEALTLAGAASGAASAPAAASPPPAAASA